MEAVLASVADSLKRCSAALANTTTYREECFRLGRFLGKLQLICVLIELSITEDESLRGNRSLFLALESAVNAAQATEALFLQAQESRPAEAWPFEDAMEFQNVICLIIEAMSQLANTDAVLPSDILQDARHFIQQLEQVNFTAEELEESCQVELEAVHKSLKKVQLDSVMKQPQQEIDQEKKGKEERIDANGKSKPTPISVADDEAKKDELKEAVAWAPTPDQQQEQRRILSTAAAINKEDQGGKIQLSDKKDKDSNEILNVGSNLPTDPFSMQSD